MKYPKKEKQIAEEKAEARRHADQAKAYEDAGSFEEYALKCAAAGIDRKISLFGTLDPFWAYYLEENDELGQVAFPVAIAVSVALNVALAAVWHFAGVKGGWLPFAGGAVAGAASLFATTAVLHSAARKAYLILVKNM